MAVTIFTEGEWDTPFIKAVIRKIFGPDKLKEITFINTSGWTNLSLNLPLFQEASDKGDINLVIFDADGAGNNGGFEKRLGEIMDERKNLEIEFELFLLPNHADDGMFENLLENVASDKHKPILGCFASYVSCVEKCGDGDYTLPPQKSKIFAYMETVLTPRQMKDERKAQSWGYENPEIWNLDSEALESLKSFLRTHIQ